MPRTTNGYQLFEYPSLQFLIKLSIEPIFGLEENRDQNPDPCIYDMEHLDLKSIPRIFWPEDLDLELLLFTY